MPTSDPVAAHRCYIHQDGEALPEVFLHEHHKTPRAYGGKEGDNLVWLCVPCHDLLHRLATMQMSGKGGKVQDYLELYLPLDLKARERFKELIQDVTQARLAFEEKALEEDDTINLNLTIPKTLHGMLKTASMDFTKPNGRKMGLYAFCVASLKRTAVEHLFGESGASPLSQPTKTELYKAKTNKAPTLKRLK